MVVALLIPLCYLAWYFLTPAPQRGPNVQQLVDAQLRNYACSELSGIVDAEGAVVVSGFVSKPGEIEQVRRDVAAIDRSEEHTSELQSLMRISYAVFCLKKKKTI